MIGAHDARARALRHACVFGCSSTPGCDRVQQEPACELRHRCVVCGPCGPQPCAKVVGAVAGSRIIPLHPRRSMCQSPRSDPLIEKAESPRTCSRAPPPLPHPTPYFAFTGLFFSFPSPVFRYSTHPSDACPLRDSEFFAAPFLAAGARSCTLHMAVPVRLSSPEPRTRVQALHIP